MFNFPTNMASSSPKGKKLKPGVYNSVIDDIKEADGYAPGNAVTLYYTLTDSTGNSYKYKETFYIMDPVPFRTLRFTNYLTQFGIGSWEDLLGACETVLLEYEVKFGNKRYLNIIDRMFVLDEAEDDETDV